MAGRRAERAGHVVIACLWVPYFGIHVARRAEPRLGEQPLVLLDERGRVVAADTHAAQAGVRPDLTERQAAARCPEASLLPAARFPIAEAHERFLSRITGYTDRWQPDGSGRAYLQAPLPAHTGRPAAVQNELMNWCKAVAAEAVTLGWQPALGATSSKFGASVASLAAIRHEALLLAPDIQRDFLASQSITNLPLETDALHQLKHLGIRTLGQYTRLPATGVLTRFGQPGRTAQRWAQGLDDRPVVPPWEAPQVSARLEFDTPLADSTLLLASLARQAERLLAPLRDRLQAIGRLLIAFTRADGKTITVAHTFPLPTAASTAISLALSGLLDRAPWDGQGAAEATLTLAGITDMPGQQLALFTFTDDDRARLTATLDQLAARFGADAFKLATLVDPDNLMMERRAAFVPWR